MRRAQTYTSRTLIAAAIALVVLAGVLVWAALAPAPLRWVLAAIPVLAAVVALWAIAQRFLDATAHQRERLLLATAAAGGVVVLVAFAAGIVQALGGWRVNPALLVLVWAVAFVAVLWWRTRAEGPDPVEVDPEAAAHPLTWAGAQGVDGDEDVQVVEAPGLADEIPDSEAEDTQLVRRDPRA